MSIASEITRLQNAKASLKASINAKGGSLTNETLDQYASAVNALPSPKEEETKTVTPNFASGNVVVTPTSGKVMTQVTIQKDANLLADNIKKDVTVHGVTGTLESGGGTPMFPNVETIQKTIAILSYTPDGDLSDNPLTSTPKITFYKGDGTLYREDNFIMAESEDQWEHSVTGVVSFRFDNYSPGGRKIKIDASSMYGFKSAQIDIFNIGVSPATVVYSGALTVGTIFDISSTSSSYQQFFIRIRLYGED